MICTRCDGTGFLNLEQVDDDTRAKFVETADHEVILDWINARTAVQREGCTCAVTHPPCAYCENLHDVSVCDCCGDGEDWYGEPGQHDLCDTTVPFPQCY